MRTLYYKVEVTHVRPTGFSKMLYTVVQSNTYDADADKERAKRNAIGYAIEDGMLINGDMVETEILEIAET